MALLNDYLDECAVELKKNDARFVFIGDRSPFSPEMQAKMAEIERASLGKPYTANIALNYGGRDELVHATNVTEEDITSHLYTTESPPLDVIVRTGGDYRISNFLLWQAAYAELYFTDTLWPDFKPSDVDEIVENFKKRDRRFGGVKE